MNLRNQKKELKIAVSYYVGNPVLIENPNKKPEYHNAIPNNRKERVKIYRLKVEKITNEQNLCSLKDIEKRSFEGYHIDHKISLHYGFKKNIPPFLIGDICNLRVISAKENKNKSTKIFIDNKNKHILENGL